MDSYDELLMMIYGEWIDSEWLETTTNLIEQETNLNPAYIEEKIREDYIDNYNLRETPEEVCRLFLQEM